MSIIVERFLTWIPVAVGVPVGIIMLFDHAEIIGLFTVALSVIATRRMKKLDSENGSS